MANKKKNNTVSSDNSEEVYSMLPFFEDTNYLFTTHLPTSLDTANYPNIDSIYTIKAWYLLVSTIREATPEKKSNMACQYLFNSAEFAKKACIYQGRTKKLEEALDPLTEIPIRMSDEDRNNLDQDYNLIKTHLIMSVNIYGRKKNKPMYVLIHPVINDIIQHSFAAVDYDFDDIAKMKTVRGINMFTFLRRLYEDNIRKISVKAFRKRAGIKEEQYAQWRSFRVRVLEPIEKEIRTCTQYKNFHFTPDGVSEGGRGHKTEYIYFDFELRPVETETSKLIEEPPSFAGIVDKRKQERLAEHSITLQKSIYRLITYFGFKADYVNLILSKARAYGDATVISTIETRLIGLKKGDLKKDGGLLTDALKRIDKKSNNRRTNQIRVKASQVELAFEEHQKSIKMNHALAKKKFETMPFGERVSLWEEHHDKIYKLLSKAQRDKVRTNDLANVATRKNNTRRLFPDCRKALCIAMIKYIETQ